MIKNGQVGLWMFETEIGTSKFGFGMVGHIFL